MCSVSGCGRETTAKGYCKRHYENARRHAKALGRPLNRQTIVFRSKAEPAEPSEAGRRRGEVRRKIENLEEAIRLRREDDW